MSFPKAKIQRFNDVQTCTPSPADYNVTLKSHVAGAVIPKTNRFTELHSPAHSDTGSSVSNSFISSFRTPNPPRKLKQGGAERKPKPLELFQNSDNLEALKDKIVECNHKDLYIQDLTEQLEEMKQQLSNLKEEITRLNNDKLQLENTMEKLSGDRENSIKDLQTGYQLEMNKLNKRITEVNAEMVLIKEEYAKLKHEYQKELTDVLKTISTLETFNDRITDSYKLLVDEKTKEVDIKDNQIKRLEEDFTKLQISHTQQIEDLSNKHKLERQDVEYEMLKTVTDMQKQLEKVQQEHKKNLQELSRRKETEINNLQVQFEEEKLKLQNDSEAKIKQLTENYKEATLLADMQMKEKCNDIEISWKLKLDKAKEEADAILKECQAIAEYNIIQSEVEKNKALYDLSQLQKDFDLLKTENDTLKGNYRKLEDNCKQEQVGLRTTISALNETREKLTRDLQAHRAKEEQLIREKHTYEVTISKTHKTVETLKKRLMRSDQDVEQLKAELEATEESKLEFEGKCNQLMSELQIVCGLCDDMEEQNKLALSVAKEKINELELQLLDKVENYKEKANEEVSVVSKQLNKTSHELKDVMEHLHNQQILNTKAQALISKSEVEIEHLERINDENVNKIACLELTVSNLKKKFSASHDQELMLNKANASLTNENQNLKTAIAVMQSKEEDLIKQLGELRETCRIYKDVEPEKKNEEAAEMHIMYLHLQEQYDIVKQKLDIAEEENRKLLKKVAEQESLIGPFREHLEAYELEYKALMGQKQDAEKEAREMGLKYAEMLGHQNQKQKIKHLMDLKKKNFELSERIKELEGKLRTQTRTVEKLKKELSAFTKSPKKLRQQPEDKENMNSPNRTLNSSRIESPGGPLRDRN